ncbi:MAG TPA: low-specificity L-threonine aldolase [Peptococcaceae bacterium]|nr:low-specificity L-threonine aldolase [Peptococcaceae bacterium]
MRYIDLRSDTVTAPTQEMRDAMYTAQVGDDVYGDDPTVIKLEQYAAEIAGKEAALFVPSGTFGNQLAIFTHCRRGDEVILGEDCHIVVHEVGAAAVIAGVNLRPLTSNKGVLNPQDIASRMRSAEDDIHYPQTSLICLENAHSNGRVIPLENMREIFEIAKERHVPVHLDGARLFNAAAYLGVDAREITKYCDSVMFCLSKGLCAPFGSMLAGTKKFIAKARKKRKLMGGGLRQAGIMAAAGLVALERMRERLPEDHANARLLGEKLAEIPGIKVFTEDIHINMVFFDINGTGCEPAKLVTELAKKGIKINGAENGLLRLVTNYWVTRDDVLYAAKCIKEIVSSS